MKSTILIAWFLVSLVAGVIHYNGPYSETECKWRVNALLKYKNDLKISYAYCTEEK